MKAMKNFAVSMLVALICAVMFGAFFASCENGIDGTPSFTASVKTVKIEVPIHVTDTVWNNIYVPVHDTTVVVVRDTTTIEVEVIKKEGLEKRTGFLS